MYKTEAAFSRAFTSALRNRNYSVSRIETGLTSTGVPDMFIAGNGDDLWIELKNEKALTYKKVSALRAKTKVKWRPMQQAWAYDYYEKHNKNKYTITVIAGYGLFVLVKMKCIYSDNIITFDDTNDNVIVFKSLTSLVDYIDTIIRR